MKVCKNESLRFENGIHFYCGVIGYFNFNNVVRLQACKAGRVQHVEQLLFYRIDINKQNSGGNTALHIAAVNNQVQNNEEKLDCFLKVLIR